MVFKNYLYQKVLIIGFQLDSWYILLRIFGLNDLTYLSKHMENQVIGVSRLFVRLQQFKDRTRGGANNFCIFLGGGGELDEGQFAQDFIQQIFYFQRNLCQI